MGASLGLALANMIMTYPKKCTVNELINNEVIKFCARYVSGTLLLVKIKGINYILGHFNSFHPNLQFAVDTFEKVFLHFLDLKIYRNRLSVSHKDTRTGE